MVKLIRLRKVFLIKFIFVFAGSLGSAKTLRELAQNSNLLLVLTDRVSSSDAEVKKRSCGLSHEQISIRSQMLKAQIDQKIESLTEADYRILEKRAQNCELDCSCDIYALAFEKKERSNALLNQKASQMTLKDREKCVRQIQKICARVN